MPGNLRGLVLLGAIFFSFCNCMNRTVTVPLNYNNIPAQGQFGSGKGLSDVKIQYNFMDEIL